MDSAGTATVLGGVIDAEQLFALNIINTVLLYNQEPTYVCARSCGVCERVSVSAWREQHQQLYGVHTTDVGDLDGVGAASRC
jgi:hypothetical protein